MSIQGEIDRLSAAKASIAASLQAMGIEPPEGTTLEQYAAQLAAIATAAPWLSIPGGGTMQMGESLGAGPYTIEVTEDGEGGDLSAAQVGYNNEGTGITATNVQDAVTELFTSVSEGKAAIAAAITDKGVATAADATFQQMAEKIGEIQSTPEYELVEVSTSGANTQFITLKDGALLATFDRDSTVQIVKGTIFTFAYNISSPSITGDLKNLGVDTRGYPMIKVNGAGSIKIGGSN